MYCNPSKTSTNALWLRNAHDPSLTTSISLLSTPNSLSCRTSVPNQVQQNTESISDVSRRHPKSTSNKSKEAQFIMTTSSSASPRFPIIPLPPTSDQPVEPAILTESAPLPVTSSSPTSTQPSSTSIAKETQSIVNPPVTHHGLSNSAWTAIIVVPIVLLAILSPMLILWFIGWRRKRRHRSQTRPSAAPEGDLLEGEKEKRSMSTIASQGRGVEGSSLPKRSTASLPPPRREFARDVQKRRSIRRPRTSLMSRTSLSGFNFDFSRRATMFSARSTQPNLQDPNPRRSSTNTWSLPPVSSSRPMSPAQASLASPMEHSRRPESPSQPQHSVRRPDIGLGSSSDRPAEVLARLECYGQVHLGPPRPLSDENVSVHNSSNLQYPFFQPHSDAVSDISGLSFDHRLWIATQGRQLQTDAVSEVSALDQDPRSSPDIHQLV